MRAFAGIVAICATFLFISSCKDDSTSNSTSSTTPTIAVKDLSKCKGDSPEIKLLVTNYEGVSYEYNAQAKLLKIKHINADYNCGLVGMDATVAVINNVIQLTENANIPVMYRCMCTFDIDFEISNIEPGTYTLRVPDMKEKTIDLIANPTGEYEEARQNYPWS